MKKILNKLMISAALMSGFTLFAVPQPVAAQSKADICEGIGLTGGGNGCATPAGGTTVETTITRIINLLSVVIGIIAVVMIIIGGLKYIMSSGDSNSINSAKNTVLFAIVGLVIVALAQAIVRFVLNRVVTT